jgi:hypothetical protein
LVNPITYLINGLYSQAFNPSAATWADQSWNTENLSGLFGLQAVAGDNYRYLTADNQVACGTGALACSMTNSPQDPQGLHTGCRDNSISFPYRCTITVVTGLNWYQGNGVPPSGTFDLWGVLVHEKGHWAGCNHSSMVLESDNQNVPTMVNSSNGYAERTPQQDDINCVRTARLGSNRQIAADPGLESVRSEFGGLNGSLWKVGGAGGTGATTGSAYWGSNYGVGGTSPGIVMISGGDITGVLNVHQVQSDLGGTNTANGGTNPNSYMFGHARKFSAAIEEFGTTPFFANLIVTEGSAENTSVGPVLSNVYCSYVWNAWTTCTTSFWTSTTGTYTVQVYDGGQQAGDDLAVDNLNVVLQ